MTPSSLPQRRSCWRASDDISGESPQDAEITCSALAARAGGGVLDYREGAPGERLGAISARK